METATWGFSRTFASFRPPDDEETVEVAPGAFWVAGPETGHGHRYLGEGRGEVLAIGAPPVEDVGRHPSAFE